MYASDKYVAAKPRPQELFKMASPFSEPTSLVQIFGSYKSQVRWKMNEKWVKLTHQPLAPQAQTVYRLVFILIYSFKHHFRLKVLWEQESKVDLEVSKTKSILCFKFGNSF